MHPYLNRNGNSGIVAYEYDATSIRIRFHDGKTYEYTADRIGMSNLEMLKRCADSGEGLNAAINMNPVIRNGFSRKW